MPSSLVPGQTLAANSASILQTAQQCNAPLTSDQTTSQFNHNAYPTAVISEIRSDCKLAVGVNVAANDCLSVRQTGVKQVCSCCAASWVQLQMQTHVMEMQCSTVKFQASRIKPLHFWWYNPKLWKAGRAYICRWLKMISSRNDFLLLPQSLFAACTEEPEISVIVAQQSAVLSLNYADFQPQRFLQISKFLEL